MANTQTRPNVLLRILRWFGRHKVTAVFVVLVVSLGVYLEVSGLVLRSQIRDERARFMHAQQVLYSIADEIPADGNPKVTKESSCNYTDNGAVFATKFLGCKIALKITYTDLGQLDATKLSKSVEPLISRHHAALSQAQTSQDSYQVTKYDITGLDMPCLYSALYYDDSVPDYKRDGSVEQTGNAALITLVCAQGAQSEVFPVVDN